MKKLLINTLLLVIVIGTFSRCKKSSGASNQTNNSCPITAVDRQSITDTIHWTFTYDGQNRLVSNRQINSLSGIPEEMTFQYGTGYLITTFVVQGTGYEDSLVLNSNGSVNTDYHIATNSTYFTRYAYSSDNELLQTTTTVPSNNESFTTVYTWANGDMIASSDGFTYTYDSTKKTQTGDWWQTQQYIQYGDGAWTIKNTHLQTGSNYTNGTPLKYTYDYDSKGRITSVAYGSQATQLYTYACGD